MTKKDILNGIHTLVSNNVIGSKQLMSRYKGFKEEMLFTEFLSNKYPAYIQINCGIVISKSSSKTSLDDSIYFTLVNSKLNLNDYQHIYTNSSKLNFEQLFLIVYRDDFSEHPVMRYTDETISLPVPSFEILGFDVDRQNFKATDNKVRKITDFFTPFAKRRRNSKPIITDC